MSTQSKARELIAKERQQEKHVQETMATRAAEIENAVADELNEKARELAAEKRQDSKQTEESMLSRSEAEIRS